MQHYKFEQVTIYMKFLIGFSGMPRIGIPLRRNLPDIQLSKPSFAGLSAVFGTVAQIATVVCLTLKALNLPLGQVLSPDDSKNLILAAVGLLNIKAALISCAAALLFCCLAVTFLWDKCDCNHFTSQKHSTFFNIWALIYETIETSTVNVLLKYIVSCLCSAALLGQSVSQPITENPPAPDGAATAAQELRAVSSDLAFAAASGQDHPGPMRASSAAFKPTLTNVPLQRSTGPPDLLSPARTVAGPKTLEVVFENRLDVPGQASRPLCPDHQHSDNMAPYSSPITSGKVASFGTEHDSGKRRMHAH